MSGVMVATITGSGASSTVSYILTDHLTGSNVVTNASGTVVELSDYYPYGATRIDDQAGFNEQRRYADHEYDSSTGLSYMDARYYNPNYGRFLSEDPAFLNLSNNLTDPQSLNSYAYSRNNPLKYLDPDGKSFTSSYVSGFKSQLSSLGNWLAQPTPVVVGQFLKGTFYDAPMGFAQDVGSGQFADSYVAGLNAWSQKSSEQRADALGDIAGGLTVQGGFSLAVGGLAGLAEGTVGSASIGGGGQVGSTSVKINGNSLDYPGKSWGYTLRDLDTGEIMKYGESIRPDQRYSRAFLRENNVGLQKEMVGTKRESHAWQHEQIKKYSDINGYRPRLNKSNW